MEFPQTSWTILASATLNGDESGRKALNDLCRTYWQPVASFIRAKGIPSERVEDLTQDFFVQIMDRQFFKRADPDKGRFRSFMLSSLRMFLTDDLRRRNSQKRGGHLERCLLEEGTLENVEIAVLKKRTPQMWSFLRTFLPGPASMSSLSYEELGSELGLTEGGAKTEVFRLRQQFRESLRAEVARTVGAPHEVDEELAHLRTSLERSSLL